MVDYAEVGAEKWLMSVVQIIYLDVKTMLKEQQEIWC